MNRFLPLMLLFACEATDPEVPEDSGGGGDADSDADADADADSDADADTDVTLTMKESMGTFGSLFSNDKFTLALQIGDLSTQDGASCTGTGAIESVGEGIVLDETNANQTFVITAADDPDVPALVACATNGVLDGARVYGESDPPGQITFVDRTESELGLGTLDLDPAGITEIRMVTGPITVQDFGTLQYNYNVSFEFWGPPTR